MTVQAEAPAIPDLVAGMAERRPDAVAVVDSDDSLTYADLDARANRLANLLVANGIGPESVVGVCLPRCVNLVVALLAVWRAGAAYLPVDPAHPARRVTGMLRSGGVTIVLAQRATDVQDSTLRTVVLDRDLAVANAHPATAPVLSTVDIMSTAAYVLHTSGSTGTPKPVVVHHAGIANHVGWRARTHGFGPGDRILHKTAITFDAAGWEIFAPLVSGAAVVLAPPGAERDPATLLRTVAEQEITVLQVVPSVLRAMADEPGWAACRSLRLLSSGGEQLHAELVHRIRRRLSDPDTVEVWNTYGPTECSVEVAAHRFDPAQLSGPVPIGRPVAGSRIAVVDEHGVAVPAGGTGELLAAGVGVGRGYLGRAADTAARFVPDPSGEPGARAYRTGDLVRTTADGLLEYVGRLDQQLKVNGVRIEPGEVEAALAGHPSVNGAAVIGFTPADGGTRLAAYVLTEDGTVPAGLREYLAERLPATHLPATFTGMTSFPSTGSGKVDRAALPAPDQRTEDRGDLLSPAEQLVAQVWRDLLKVETVEADDDFFGLGGSSLQLTRLANRMRKASGLSIDLGTLVSATRLADQAALIDQAAADQDRIERISRDEDLPLSFGQRRMWVLDRMRPRSREWVSALFVRIPDGTGTEQIQQALNLLLARHEALRTRFVLSDGEPIQVIEPAGEYELRTVELSDEEFPAELDRELDRSFDITTGPLTRALLRRAADHQLLVISAHHIVLDGWSSAVLEREFGELLAAVRAGRAPSLPPLELQYADFAVWQRGKLDEQLIDKELQYWRATLEGATPTAVRLDKPRPAMRDGRGAIVGFTVPATVARVLEDHGRRSGATSFMTLLTAFGTLLARYESDWDVVVGTPVAGRNRPELEGVVGFFLNNIVLRCRLDPDVGFATALATVRDTCRAAFAHQDLPFDRLVAELAPERDLSTTPLYQVAFDLHDEKLTASAANPADWDTLLDVSRIAKTDLTLYLRAEPDGTLAGGLEYATSLFEKATIERMVAHFLALLDAVAADPATPLAEVDFVPAEERTLLETAATGTTLEPSELTTLDLFERQVAATPDAVALVSGSTRVTFAELDAAANQVAHRIRAMGVGDDDVVGVLLERGPGLLTSFLGVWKAGGAYLPLDLDAPAERLELVCSDAAASVVVTTTGLADRLAGGASATLLLDAPDPAAPTSPPERTGDPDLLAYVIYTSGSTGRPKGVQIHHRGLVNHLRWAVAEMAARGSGGAPVFSSVAFDLVVPNLWAPLLAGQPVHLLPSDMDLTELGRMLSDRAPFSFIKLTPGHLEILSQQLAPGWLADLAGVVMVAGQELPSALANQWVAALGPDRLINEYGPSEATVGTCTYLLGSPETGDTVPIGKPLPGVTMRVLDSLLRPVPVGVVGEVYVGGAGLARGYAGAPAMTASRFLPDPFAADGARLYRTGDLARVLPSGDVSFVGRIDDQVKIRGYRVELGEITAALLDHPSVRDAVVLTDTGENAEVRLLAFVVAQQRNADGLAEEALAACHRRLPSYMVPASCTVVERFPLNANGKIDRGQLVSLAGGDDPVLDAPSGPTEERIAEIFASLLGHQVGVHSDFFTSGGNSIVAIRLVAAIQDAYEIDLPIRAVFEGPTVAALAGVVETRIRAELEKLSEADLSVGRQ
ncbi:non-ribosomal peptide synthetase [Actinophytocola sp.]|uniref:non-ribosomal peptide synthetase n=1 Tax=Actinophytocola sp. TaxID=1872138 RepID=UPI002D541763|nr:non-ribosomal peptide synthetase [Actinophytocola sp.]HYQ63769.1 amino acid adenylation domain-containing protein [Actinophytocola sp.]